MQQSELDQVKKDIRRLVKLTEAKDALERAAFSAKMSMMKADQAMDFVNQEKFETKAKAATELIHAFDIQNGAEIKRLETRLGKLKPARDTEELEFYG